MWPAWPRSVGAGTVNATVNTGRLYIMLKPRDQRKLNAEKIIERLRERDAVMSRAFRSSCKRRRMCRSTAASVARNIQYTLQDADEEELADWAPKLVQKLARNCRN